MSDLNKIRKAINPVLRAAGYAPWHTGADYPKAMQLTMSAGINSRYGDGFVLNCGCDHTLPQEERDRLWQENGEKLRVALADAGFQPDPAPYGADQRRIFVVRMPEKEFA